MGVFWEYFCNKSDHKCLIINIAGVLGVFFLKSFLWENILL